MKCVSYAKGSAPGPCRRELGLDAVDRERWLKWDGIVLHVYDNDHRPAMYNSEMALHCFSI